MSFAVFTKPDHLELLPFLIESPAVTFLVTAFLAALFVRHFWVRG